MIYEIHRQSILLQEVKYQAPFMLSTTPFDLAGMNYLYSPPLGRELQYGCALLDFKNSLPTLLNLPKGISPEYPLGRGQVGIF